MTFSMSLPPKTIWLDYYQYLPLLIETEGGGNYLLNNIFNTNSTLTRYWAIKELVESKFCQSRPALIESSFEKIKLMDNTRIINKALEWWEQRCPS